MNVAVNLPFIKGSLSCGPSRPHYFTASLMLWQKQLQKWVLQAAQSGGRRYTRCVSRLARAVPSVPDGSPGLSTEAPRRGYCSPGASPACSIPQPLAPLVQPAASPVPGSPKAAISDALHCNTLLEAPVGPLLSAEMVSSVAQ